MGAIDSLFVELMLDPTQFIKGSKDATDAFKKTKEEAAKSAKDMEASSARASQFFKVLAVEAGGLFSVIAGANSFKQFIVDITASNAASGRLAQQLNISTGELTTMEAAAKLAGGSTDGMAGSIQGLIGQFQQFSLTGESSIIPYFRLMNIAVTDAAGNMRPLKDMFADMAAWGQTVDPAKATSVFKGVGLDPGTITLLLKGKQAFLELYEAGKQYALTPKQAAEAQDLTNKWSALELQAKHTGNAIAEVLNPPLEGLLKLLGFIVVGVDKVAGALKNLDHGVLDNIADAAPDAAHDDSWFGWRSKVGAFRDRGREMLGLPPRGRAAAGGAAKGGGSGGGGGSGNAGVGGWWTQDPQKQAADYLIKNAGLSEAGAAGLVARWAAIESRGGPTSVNPNSGASGIAQGLGSRKAGYTGSFEDQLANAARELNTTEKRAGDVLRNAKTSAEGARGASIFERAEGYDASSGYDNFTTATPAQKVLDDLFGGKAQAATRPTATSATDPVHPIWAGAYPGGLKAEMAAADAAGAKYTHGAIIAAQKASAARLNAIHNSTETNIGEMHVHTPATDGAAFARDFKRAKDVCSLSDQANSSLR